MQTGCALRPPRGGSSGPHAIPRNVEMVVRFDVSRAASIGAATLIAFALATVSPSRARADEDPFSLLHEEQTITGASKRPHPLSETPSAVTVITAEEIPAHGYHTLGEALRWGRAVFGPYDRNYSYLAVPRR